MLKLKGPFVIYVIWQFCVKFISAIKCCCSISDICWLTWLMQQCIMGQARLLSKSCMLHINISCRSNIICQTPKDKEAFIDKSRFMRVPDTNCHCSCVLFAHGAVCPAVLHHTYQISACRLAPSLSSWQYSSSGHQILSSHKFEIPALVKMKCTIWRDWLESFHLLTCIEFLERPMGISTTKESFNMINTTLLGRNWSTFSHLLHLMNCG